MHSVPFLSLAIWIPILFGVVVLRVGSDRQPQRARWLSLIGAVVGLLLTLPLITGFDNHAAGMQFVEFRNWLPEFGVAWRLGIDGISMWLVVLTAFTTLVIVIASWASITERVGQYFGAFLILSGLMVGTFAATDGMLFFVFFEATLIPLYLLIGTWGHARRTYAAVKFFFFSFAGSLLMLLSMLYLYSQSHTFDMSAWHNLTLGFVPQILIFIGFFAAFAVKVPMWPFHTWLPDVHLEAPTGATVLMAMLKLGGYGFLRFTLPITPDAAHFFAPVIITLSLVAVVYSSLLALAQTDMTKMLAYSTVAHMGLVTLGLFLFNQIGTEGAIVQMISYGFVSGALLLSVGVLFDRTKTRTISAYGGVVNVMPRYAAFMMLFCMANLGLPGTSGFVGEFMVIMGAIRVNFWVGAIAATTVILSAAYTLWMYKRVIFGAVANKRVAKLADLGRRETLIFASLAVLVLAVGLYPKPMTDAIELSAANLVNQAGRSKQPADDGAPAEAVRAGTDVRAAQHSPT
ncbi:NADH-quinone oxidoreductase subunit M [Paraburkholderia caffeinitolerans]|uniref:NADH-quinone oxidoreductase subunit M n=1 Tax=Paraburkholderia caffeinitolerans TaxID=1723730 RepID=A0A6J5G5Q0_9BURK|nr:NADH-quinone oxidoreductase subunit M [Paraburkholderia caffeinitolerans]CAB3794208.1 NADH-quinone oxidoreductase subunit M [Paraburkholderia caffeinitolerans]